MKKVICIILSAITVISALCTCSFAKSGMFEDVSDNVWYSRYVKDCAEKGLMVGTSDKTFEPDSVLTRGMLIQILYSYYEKNIEGTDKDLNRLGYGMDYIGGFVGTNTKIDGTNFSKLERKAVVLTEPDNPKSEKEVTFSSTKNELISEKNIGIYAYNVKVDKNNIISFESDDSLTLIPESASKECSIFMSGGCCYGSGFKGCAERVGVHSDAAIVEAKTPKGARYEITLCDLGSGTCVVVRGESKGEIFAELQGYELTVKGVLNANAEVYEWNWNIGELLYGIASSGGFDKINVLPFIDINSGAYYIEALKWATSKKITAGVSKNEFYPDAPVTREQLAVFLSKFIRLYKLGYKLKDTDIAFSDKSEISPYAKESVEFLYQIGIIKGDIFGKFNPKVQAKRCEVATVFSNLDKVTSCK